MTTNQQQLFTQESDATNQHQSIEDLAADPPVELAAYWPERIIEDSLYYRKYATPGRRFYDTHHDHVYQITATSSSDTVLTLTPCSVTPITADSQHDHHPTDEHHIDNICALAGALECGELIDIDTNTLRTINNTGFIHINDTTLKFDELTPLEPDHHTFSPPNSSTVTDIVQFAEKHGIDTAHITAFTTPQTDTTSDQASTDATQQPYHDAEQPVTTRFIPVSPFSKWTFEDDTIRSWVESHFDTGDRILNACCGKTKLTPPTDGTILRNDINTDRDADFHVDVAELAACDDLQENSLDVIIFDPPWSLYQSNLRYQSNHVHQVSNSNTHNIDLSTLPFDTPGPAEKTQIGHAAIAKRGFDYLLKPGGIVIELTLHGTSMPQSLSYSRQERVIFDPVGEARAVIGSVDQKTRQQLSDFF